MQYQRQQPAHKKTRCKWLLGLIGILLILAVGYHWATSMNQGEISALPPDQSTQTAPDKVLAGKYLSFSYKGEYAANSLPAKDTDLELYMLRADNTYQKTLAVSVSQLPGGSLDNNSDYLFRKSAPDLYHSTQTEVAGGSAVIWTKNDGTEETVFVPKGNIVAVLSFTTGSTSDNLDAEVSAVLASFHWQQ